MSFGFNINSPKSKPVILEAQNMQNNGGGGNLGYFEQERKKKEQPDQEETQDVFIKDEEESADGESFLDKIKNVFSKKD